MAPVATHGSRSEAARQHGGSWLSFKWNWNFNFISIRALRALRVSKMMKYYKGVPLPSTPGSHQVWEEHCDAATSISRLASLMSKRAMRVRRLSSLTAAIISSTRYKQTQEWINSRTREVVRMPDEMPPLSWPGEETTKVAIH